VREWVEDSLVKPLLELQWLLAGIWPAGMTYEIVWASKKVITAEGVQQAADAMAKLKSTGLLPDEELIKVLVELLPVLDVDAIMAFLKTQAENEVDSLAQAIAARSGAGRRQDQTPEEEEPPDEATERRRHVHVRAIVA
jgi:ribosomal protein L12E/L44/L45/RPP1/RPP2